MLFALLLGIAAAPSAPQVAPPDPTAPFRGDGGALKFDPACRDYTLETVAANAGCAARVAQAEPGPALAIALRTLGSPTGDADRALALIRRVTETSDLPAAHYLLGSVLGSGERVRPDYPAAVRHLAIAAERGNPAAADLLASLVVAGKGTPRDLPRAIALYERAAASGFPSAASRLAQLYLDGRFLPKDTARGRAWLDALAAVVPQAAGLAAAAASDDKVANIQLLPAADPSAVKTIRYGTFDNPAIPPGFGFDPAFQAVYYAPYDDPATLARLEREAATLPTPYTYELARRLAAQDPARALATFLLARTRLSYDVARCGDPAALEAVGAWDRLIGGELRFLFAGGKVGQAAVDAALAGEAARPGDDAPWWVCRSGMAAMTAALSGRPGPLALKPTAEWPELRAAARARLAAVTAAN